MRRGSQDLPNTKRLNTALKFKAMLMICHQAALAPNRPDGNKPVPLAVRNLGRSLLELRRNVA
ncbi:hypothetical protein CSB20_08575 [bacterium DOLZORAL124_64_63]|nr:MAG: hypothetical protein CSB20_08575 [bacterium DOLZORAL124_64_63]